MVALRGLRVAVPVLVLLGGPLAPVRAQQLPPTPAGGVVDTFFGTPVADPYRWLEDLDSPEAQAWFRAQGGYARSVLDTLPGHAALLERLRQIDEAAGPEVSLPREAGGRWFYTMRKPGESVALGYVRDVNTGRERLLVDPESVSDAEPEPGTGSRLATFLPSPDGRLVLYGVTTGGAETVVLRVRDVATGRDVEGPFERNQWNETAWWDPGGRVFYYWRVRDPEGVPPAERFLGIELLRHRLGTDPRSDVAILSAAMLDGDPGLFPVVQIEPGSGVAFGTMGGDRVSTYYRASAAAVAGGSPEWRLLFPRTDSIAALVPHGEDLYLLTPRGRGSVLRTGLEATDPANADTVLVADERTTLQGIGAARDAVYVQRYSEGANRLTRIPWDGDAQPIDLPPGTSIAAADLSSRVRTAPMLDGALLTLDSWTAASSHYRYDPATDRLEALPLGSDDRPRLEGYVAETVYAPSHDGVGVPLTIVRPERIARDGTLPVMLEGYGAYGAIDFRAYSPSPWWDAGGAWATCHVRGGGYYGEPWHQAGSTSRKANSWLDFIACAEYLVTEGYTRPHRLVAGGGSAGGITVGRALTERPDLFAAAIITNGVLDAIRNVTTAVGAANIPEFGSVETEEGFRSLLAMSAYHHVRPGTAYPAVLLEVGLEDIRVPPWESARRAFLGCHPGGSGASPGRRQPRVPDGRRWDRSQAPSALTRPRMLEVRPRGADPARVEVSRAPLRRSG
jgi:prolyl oligopeptidase